MTEPKARTPSLTPRQEQILTGIGEGMTNREIGERLGVAEKTIKNSVTVIFATLGVTRRAQAALHAANARNGRLGPVRRQPTPAPATRQGRSMNSVRTAP